jgi:hypothetical protein
MKKVLAISTLAALAGVANAQFVVTGPATVDSWAAAGNPNNGQFGGTYMGPSGLFGSIGFTGTLVDGGVGTWSSEARWRITDGNGNITNAQFQGGMTFTDPIPVNASLGALVWLNSGDSWNFEAFESFTDSSTAPDAIWENPEFTIDGSVSITNLGNLPSSGSIDTGGSSYDTELSLYTSDGILIATNDDAPGFGLQSQINYADLAVGDYLIVVGGFNSFFNDGLAFAGAANGDYELNFNGGLIADGTQGAFEFAVFSFSVIPAPSSAVLLALGGLVATRRRRA